MISCKQDDYLVKKSFFILLQVLFTFLTMFFFTYVNEASIIISGYLDFAEEYSLKHSTEDDKRVSAQNNKIINKAFLWIVIACTVLLIITVILVLSGYCIPFKIYVKESFTVVFFVAVTEFIFLFFITRNYWSVNPVIVRDEIADVVQKYIKNR